MRIENILRKMMNIRIKDRTTQALGYCNLTAHEGIKLTQIGELKWPRVDMKSKLKEFSELYEIRPEKNNAYGMKAPHLFLSWFVMQAARPECIIESGVYKGLGTWFFEQACPGAEIHSIDIALGQRKYISKKVKYYNFDFSRIDWGRVNKEKTICFFDDHQNAVERLKLLASKGFKKAIFEDNYPTGQGDCYSLKQAFDKDTEDAAYLKSVIKVYNELPPVYKTEKTRWGDTWSKERYPTVEPLFNNPERDDLRVFLNEANHYNWLCYVELK